MTSGCATCAQALALVLALLFLSAAEAVAEPVAAPARPQADVPGAVEQAPPIAPPIRLPTPALIPSPAATASDPVGDRGLGTQPGGLASDSTEADDAAKLADEVTPDKVPDTRSDSTQAPSSHTAPQRDTREPMNGALDQAAVEQLCQRIDTKLSSVGLAECRRVNLRASGAVSNEGISIAYRDFSAAGAEPLRVLLVGGIHGDEYSSVSVVFKWLNRLQGQAEQAYHWRVVPVLNPDGLLRPPGMSQRMNANGVDLNRNFPTPDWLSEAPRYWEQRTHRNPRRYPGPAPLSEPESAWLAEQIEHFRPDAVISVHAPHGIVDFDGPHTPPENLGPLELRLLGTYPGSMGRYIGVHKAIPLLTVELESAFRMPSEGELVEIWDDMLVWIERKLVPIEDADRRNARLQSTLAPVDPPAEPSADIPALPAGDQDERS